MASETKWKCDKCGQHGETWEGCALAECGAYQPFDLRLRAAAPPTPAQDGVDFAAADAIAEAYLVPGGLGDVLPDAQAMARAYLALRARPALPEEVQAAVNKIERDTRYDLDDDVYRARVGDLRALLAHLTRGAQ